MDPIHRRQKNPFKDKTVPQPALNLTKSNYPRFPDVSFIKPSEKIDFWTKPKNQSEEMNCKRKIPAFIMVNLFTFLTLDKIMNHTCKLTKNDRSKLANNRHIL